MKIVILSRNARLYSTRRLVQAARMRGHQVRVIDTLTVAVEIGGPRYVEGASNPSPAYPRPSVQLPEADAVIPRIGTSITPYGLAVVRQFEAQGVLTTATSQAIACSRDKLHSLQLMAQVGLPIPKTAVIARVEDLLPAIQSVGGLPAVIKVSRGTQGQGVVLASTLQMAEAAFAQLSRPGRQVLVQEFVVEAEGCDTRVIVVGNQCVAAMRRTALAGEFRANLHLGGTAASIPLDKQSEQLALAAVRAHGLSFAGADLIQSRRGPLVLEVNSSPGLEGIERATRVDIAAEIIRFLEIAARKKHGRSRKKQRRRR